ncbi:TfpX/TfpZ family type IV pilin accessory protein [Undibacterium rugosum]|uniref:Pilus assembly protein n=1 Tax=Undibacterium rugosum TaxID=2762291 RepID=A0A923I3V8_9BURK|nr:TfpX/TfpZ family type IV pilin accessory protein [Undibacterium rugosum]MBC3936042.1 pilus assembly protein [Undibacterium rugosum]MBR7778625.1 pilus assembly protein [Undibacterium rugosum]
MSTGKPRLKAATLHLLVSGVIAGVVTALILLLWYPGQYAEIARGLKLIILVAGVDIVLGPLLTLVVFNPVKSRTELVRDISVIALLQASALIYGVHTVFVARPVALVFEGSQFRLVSAAEVEQKELVQASPGLRKLSLTGPIILGAREFKDAKEKSDATFTAFAGADIGVRPSFWQNYEQSAEKVKLLAKPLSILRSKYPGQKALIDRAVQESGLPDTALGFVPLIARGTEWSVLVDAESSAVKGFVKLDGF